MTDREKLIELLSEAEKVCFVPMWLPPEERLPSLFSQIADHLLANGVTFATDTKVGGKWIPVTERLPELFCGVLVWTPMHQNQYCAYLNARNEWHTFDTTPAGILIRDHITHWMPLPEPPKGG